MKITETGNAISIIWREKNKYKTYISDNLYSNKTITAKDYHEIINKFNELYEFNVFDVFKAVDNQIFLSMRKDTNIKQIKIYES